MNQAPILCNCIPTDLLLLMTMQITFWFALAGFVWFLGWMSACYMIQALQTFRPSANSQRDNQAKARE